MKTLLVFFFTLASSQLVQADNAGHFYFNYISNDGEFYLDCVHQNVGPEPDLYHVVCGKGTNLVKTFDIRFRVRQLRLDPKPAYEIAFWVADRNSGSRIDENSTVWVTLSKGALTDVTLHEDVENAYAAVTVHYSAGL